MIILYFSSSCVKAPEDHDNKNNSTNSVEHECNRSVYGRVAYLDKLPEYLCIPQGYIVDYFVLDGDINNDGMTDFIALKYNKKEDDQNDGDTTFYNFYYRNQSTERFELINTFSNLVPPYISNYSWEYLSKNDIAASIYDNYPLRMFNKNLSFEIEGNLIRLAYKYNLSFGKSFIFEYHPFDSDWVLKDVEYFMGELPETWWSNEDFYYPLMDGKKTLFSFQPRHNISLKDFSLIEAFRFSEEEDFYIYQEYHLQLTDSVKSTNRSIVEFEFASPNKNFEPPSDWKY